MIMTHNDHVDVAEAVFCLLLKYLKKPLAGVNYRATTVPPQEIPAATDI
jgi:hypothetical protein